MKTANGIYYNLEESEYRIESTHFIYVFSSQFYYDNFLERSEKVIRRTNDSISNRFGVEVHLGELGLIRLYERIEKRGFLIIEKESGVVHKCKSSIVLGGVKPISKNFGLLSDSITENVTR